MGPGANLLRHAATYSCLLDVQCSVDRINNIDTFVINSNKPFYSCVLSYPTMNANEAGGALIQTSLLFSCKCQLVSKRTT